MAGTTVVGRDVALREVTRFLDTLDDGPAALLVEGEAGIGKTTVWQAAAAAAAERGHRVVAATAVEGESDLPFVAVRDLLDPLPLDTAHALPAPQRDALDAALLRSDRPDAVADQHAVCVAVLGVVRALAAERPLVLAVDDVAWLDRASDRVLRFVVRRLTTEPVGVLAARRPAVEPGVPLGLDGTALRRIELGPLDPDAVHALLVERHGLALPRRTTRRIHAACGGNPFAAVELARAVAAGEDPDLDAPPLPTGVLAVTADRIAALGPPARRTLAVAATAAAPTVELLAAAVGERARDGLDEAVAHGLLEVAGAAVRFPHPLLRSAAAATLSARDRRALHHELAGLVTDPDERAAHLGAGAVGPDESVAAALDRAARRALVRGAPDVAAEVAARATALTPPGAPDARARRRILTAEYRYRAEDVDAARSDLAELVGELPAGPVRAEALLWLANVRQAQNGMAEAVELSRRALAEADAPALRAAAERDLALALLITGNVPAGDAHAANALATARRTGDPTSVAESEAALAWTQFWLGAGLRTDLLEGARRYTTWSRFAPHEASPGVVVGLLTSWADQHDDAAATLAAELARLAELGQDRPRAVVLFAMAEREARVGAWDAAHEHALEGLRVAEDADDAFYRSLLLYVRGMVAALRGDLAAARADAQEAIAVGTEVGSAVTLGFAGALLGFVALSEGDAAAAAEHLAPLVAALPADGRFDPGIARFVPDAVEALVTLGRTGEAALLLEPFAAQAVALDRPWALAAAARCRALLLSAAGDHSGALAAAEAALAAHARADRLPFERARTLLVAGTVRRRARRRRDARAALDAALAALTGLGAVAWAELARAELGRIGGRAPSTGALTDTERRIIERVVAGRTNKEVAADLHLAIGSVEAALWKIYRKIGVRSRTELAAALRAGE